MVAAAKDAVRSTQSLAGQKSKRIREETADIRSRWSIGQRHYRARLALELQHRLFCEAVCAGTAPLNEGTLSQ
ncbi:MAG TPA: hypothetical protein VGJ15_11470 [Pirellulales bacterium]|jgi:hypothetical protein